MDKHIKNLLERCGYWMTFIILLPFMFAGFVFETAVMAFDIGRRTQRRVVDAHD